MLLSDVFLLYIKDFLEIIGVIVICIGAFQALYNIYMSITLKKYGADYIRLQFGKNVILGLEFMVAGDIVGSLIKPDYYNLGMLGIIVVIRTILSYFLNKEVQELTPQEQHSFKNS